MKNTIKFLLFIALTKSSFAVFGTAIDPVLISKHSAETVYKSQTPTPGTLFEIDRYGYDKFWLLPIKRDEIPSAITEFAKFQGFFNKYDKNWEKHVNRYPTKLKRDEERKNADKVFASLFNNIQNVSEGDVWRRHNEFRQSYSCVYTSFENFCKTALIVLSYSSIEFSLITEEEYTHRVSEILSREQPEKHLRELNETADKISPQTRDILQNVWEKAARDGAHLLSDRYTFPLRMPKTIEQEQLDEAARVKREAQQLQASDLVVRRDTAETKEMDRRVRNGESTEDLREAYTARVKKTGYY